MRGILYIATGDQYIDEAIATARHNSNYTDLPTAIITDRELTAEVFDTVIIDEDASQSFGDKVNNLKESPFDETLFLDTDCYLGKDIEHLFDILAGYDLAITIDAYETSHRLITEEPFPEVPEAVPEFNTGVILFSQEAIPLLNLWQDLYEDTHIHDQPSFRAAAYQSNIDILPLSNVYNCFLRGPTQISGEAAVLHDAGGGETTLNIDECIDSINDEHGVRIFSEVGGRITTKLVPTIKFRVTHLINKIEQDGIVSGVSSIIKYIKQNI